MKTCLLFISSAISTAAYAGYDNIPSYSYKTHFQSASDSELATALKECQVSFEKEKKKVISLKYQIVDELECKKEHNTTGSVVYGWFFFLK